MSRALPSLAALVSILGVAALVHAQHAESAEAPGIRDVPSGPAILRGQVIHETDPARAAGVEVLLYALSSDGGPGLRRGRTDGQGRFVFEGISNDPETAYLLGARYGDIPFPGARVSFEAGETERSVTVRIGESTSSAEGVDAPQLTLMVQWVGGRLAISEQHQLENRGELTVYVDPTRRNAESAIFDTVLPEGAQDFGFPLGVAPAGLVRDGEQVRFFGPLYPSEWEEEAARDQGIGFHYALSAQPGTRRIEKPLPRGARRVVVRTPRDGPSVELEGAHAEQTTEEGLRQWVLEDVEPGGALRLSIEIPEARRDLESLRLTETRVFLEMDDAALLVREEHAFSVEGASPLLAPEGDALLSVPLPDGAQDIRFGREGFAWGLSQQDGALTLQGPVPPGEHVLPVAYHLSASPAGVEFERRFTRELPLLSVFVADTGLRTETDRLHRRRPIRTPDRIYLHLEAFQVEPGETVELGLVPLRAGTGAPRGLLYAAVAGLAALAALFLAAPLRAGPAKAEVVEELEDATRRERDAVYAALRDLEHDHETAKISDEDYGDMRQELRARAVALLRAERERAPAGASAPSSDEPASSPGLCPACDAPASAGHRFCSQCGTRLQGSEEERGARA